MSAHMRAIQVLLVEDDAADVRLTEEALKTSRFSLKLEAVDDGEKAIRYLRREGEYSAKQRPDLIVLDLNLPRKDGREVLLEIKHDEDLKKIPVVVLTTSNAASDVSKVYAAGGNCFITKPLDFRDFQKAVLIIEDFWFSIARLPE